MTLIYLRHRDDSSILWGVYDPKVNEYYLQEETEPGLLSGDLTECDENGRVYRDGKKVRESKYMTSDPYLMDVIPC